MASSYTHLCIPGQGESVECPAKTSQSDLAERPRPLNYEFPTNKIDGTSSGARSSHLEEWYGEAIGLLQSLNAKHNFENLSLYMM